MFVFRNVVTVCLDDLLIAACQECGVKTSAKNEPSCSVAFSLTGTKSCHARNFQKQRMLLALLALLAVLAAAKVLR